jgi:threonine/homoserine/homoserine lactone efflux protein
LPPGPPTKGRKSSGHLGSGERAGRRGAGPVDAWAMLDLTQLALYVAAALLLAVTPGPGLFYVAARTLAGGRAEGVASSSGTGLGGMVHVIAGGLGVSAVVFASAELFTALKLIGAAYLVWLGFRTFRSARRDASAGLDGGPAAPPIGPRRAFREGVLVEALNPKTAAFFLALVPQFVVPADGNVAVQFVVLGFVSVAFNTLADIAAAFAASGIREGAVARPTLIRRLREASGAAMLALGIGLALAKRPPT